MFVISYFHKMFDGYYLIVSVDRIGSLSPLAKVLQTAFFISVLNA